MRPFFRGKTIIIPATQTQNRLDARGMNRLQRSGTLPTVWIPSADRGVSSSHGIHISARR